MARPFPVRVTTMAGKLSSFPPLLGGRPAMLPDHEASTSPVAFTAGLPTACAAKLGTPAQTKCAVLSILKLAWLIGAYL